MMLVFRDDDDDDDEDDDAINTLSGEGPGTGPGG